MTRNLNELLVTARESVRANDPDDTYDELLRIVSDRAAQAGCLTKADIGSLVLWKRISAQTTWARALGMTPDKEVKRLTADAWKLANDERMMLPRAGQAARDALRPLSGMGGPAMASAVLVACAPQRMAVWDRHVKTALTALGRQLPNRQTFYHDYLVICTGLMVEVSTEWVPRDVDLALFNIGADSGLLEEARQLGS